MTPTCGNLRRSGMTCVKGLQYTVAMKVKVKLFASLRENMGFAGKELEFDDTVTVTDVWQHLAGDKVPPNVLMAINMDYVAADAPVHEGDEVAFFPPVTGG